jgi:hypothetical protein
MRIGLSHRGADRPGEAPGRNLAAEQKPWLSDAVAFGGGTPIYFTLQTEPSIGFASVAGLAAALCAARKSQRGHGDAFSWRDCCRWGFGLAGAQLRSVRVDAPIIAHDMGADSNSPDGSRVVDIRPPNRVQIVLAP